jgi:predicted ribosome quality control (RQC) complex YloA/Tae2 family protein
MAMNWIEINTVLEELDLEDSFIQKVRQTDYKDLILEVYKPGQAQKVLLSLIPGQERIHGITRPFQAMSQPSRFVQLLRSKIKGYKLGPVNQWGAERIISFPILSSPPTTLYFRLWGGAANIFLTDAEGRIIDAAFRRPKRGEMSGSPLVLPEKNDPKSNLTLRELPGVGPFQSRLEEFYAKQAQGNQLEESRARARKGLMERITFLETKTAALQNRIDQAQDSARWNRLGEMILAEAHNIKTGQGELQTKDWEDGSSLVIPLNPQLSPQENAAQNFKKAQKLKNALELLKEEQELRVQDLGVARANLQRIDEVQDPKILEAWSRSPKPQEGAKTSGQSQPGLQFRLGAFTLWVGRNAKENEALLKMVKGKDLWLHTRDYAGGYVFIRRIPGKTVPLEILLDAGQLAVHYSKGKGGGKTDLYYTEVKFLKKPKGGKRGLVLPTQEKNLTIDYDSQRVNSIMEDRV